LIVHPSELSPGGERCLLDGVLGGRCVVQHGEGQAKAGIDQRAKQIGESAIRDWVRPG